MANFDQFDDNHIAGMVNDAISSQPPPLIARPADVAPPVTQEQSQAPADTSSATTMDTLRNLDDSQLSQLVQSSYLTPDQASQIQAARGAANDGGQFSTQKMGTNVAVDPQAVADLSQGFKTQAALQNVQASQPAQTEMANDRVNSFMQGTGLEKPTQRPTPLMPQEPTAQQSAQQEALAQQAAEQEAAARRAAEELAQAKAQHAANIDKAASDKVTDQDARAKAAAGSDSNWGQIVGQGIAVALGEYGRHLTGGTENLALKTIERLSNEKAAKDKLSMEDKIAMQKHAIDIAQVKLKEQELRTDSDLKRAQIGKISAEMAKVGQELALKQNVMARMGSGQGFTAEELQVIPDKDRQRAVLLPDGSYKLAVSAGRAKDATTAVDSASQARDAIKKLIDYTDYFGNNPAKKVFAREEIAQAQALQGQLKGAMRILLVGPGNVSTYEHELMNKIIKDPTAIFSLGSANKAALTQLLHKTQAAETRALRGAGISVPPSANDINIAKLRQAAPSMTEKQAEDILIKSGQWKD